MPKSPKCPKYYAVKIGRYGPKIYHTWDECKESVTRYPGAVHKSFRSKNEAENWIAVPAIVRAVFPVPSTSNPGTSGAITSNSEALDHLDSFLKETPTKQNVSRPIVISTVPSKMVLSPEQKLVLQTVKARKNVFFTGSAGTGKSVLLREIIKELGGRGPSSTLGITASTGIASVNIGGSTLHSWGGLGIGNEPATAVAAKLLNQKTCRKALMRWLDAEALIIDEISMVDGVLFDKLEEIARLVRKNERPFGGIQLILSGDFYQLPPVSDRNSQKSCFAFDANSWKSCVGSPITLTRVFRQKDSEFVDILNAMRFGQLEPRTVAKFQSLSREIKYDDGIAPTELYPTREQVNNANNSRLQKLQTQQVEFRSRDIPGRDSNGQRLPLDRVKKLLDRVMVSELLSLKVGAQVMLVKNLVQGSLVNGSIGVVEDFTTFAEAIKLKTEIPGYDQVQDDLAKFFRPPPKDETKYPVVRFLKGKTVLIVPVDFSVNGASGDPEATRTQVPLILAWALSVHKSQGQTLERVKVDLGRTFEKGQAYVALSRATSLEGLQVINFQAHKVQAHSRVVAWHKEIGGGCTIDEEMDDDEFMFFD